MSNKPKNAINIVKNNCNVKEHKHKCLVKGAVNSAIRKHLSKHQGSKPISQLEQMI